MKRHVTQHTRQAYAHPWYMRLFQVMHAWIEARTSFMTKTQKEHTPLVLLMLLSVLAYHQWLSFKTFFYADWVQYSYHSLAHTSYSSTWSSTGIGTTNITFSRVPAQVVQYWISALSHSGTNVTDKLIFFWPIIILVPLAGYALANLVTKNRWLGALGGMVFSFNTYFLAMNYEGDEMITMAAAACVLGLVMYIKALHSDANRGRRLIYSIFFLLLASAYDFRIVYMTGFLLAFYTLCVASKRNIKLFCALCLLLLGICAFWLLPLEASASLTSNAAFDRTLFGDNFWSLSAAITLFYPFWTGHTPTWFDSQNVPLYLWLVPILVVLGLMILRRNLALLFFAVAGLIGILLAKQVQAPFVNLYQWLYSNFPGFNAFREASKFYTLIIIAYTAILAMLVRQLVMAKNTRIRYAGYAIGVLIAGVFAYNLKPLLTNQIGGVLAPRHLPSAYADINRLLDVPGAFYRTLWVPTTSSWVDQTDNRPTSGAANLITNWQNALNTTTSMPLENQLASEITEPISKVLASAAAFKYIAVPLRDIPNDDDSFVYYGNDRSFYTDTLNSVPWLTRVPTSKNGVALYRNSEAKPYITTSTNLTTVSNLYNINSLYNFSASQGITPGFNFQAKSSKTDLPSVGVQDIFSQLQPNDFTPGSIHANITSLGDGTKTLYANTTHPTLSYQDKNATLNVYEANPNNLRVNGKSIAKSTLSHQILSAHLALTQHYYLGQGRVLTAMQPSRNTFLGTATNSKLTLFATTNANLVPNASFAAGLWQKKVSDCNDYNNTPMIAMNLGISDSSDVQQSLQLAAGEHTACTGPNPIAVHSDGYYRLAFTYKTAVADHAGYILTFNNPGRTVRTVQIPKQSQWTTFSHLIQVPTDATSMSITLLGYPDPQLEHIATTNYAELTLNALTQVAGVPMNTTPKFTKIPITAHSHITYASMNYTYQNLIPDASFNAGLWQAKVGDCDNFDNNPILGMKLDHNLPSKGQDTLELDATRHSACTGPKNAIKVTPNTKLFFSFQYQSPNAADAAYYISFNDPAHTFETEQLPITNSSWHNYSTELAVPSGATKLSLLVYSYASTANTINVVTRYANFHLYAMPDIANSYFLVSAEPKQLAAPAHIDFKINSPSKTTVTVTVTDAMTPFYLNMSEAYDVKWQLSAGKTIVPASDHYEWDSFANGWYINTAKLCRDPHVCIRNSNGSYNLTLQITYAPQKWFYFGLVISGLTFSGCIAYLILQRRLKHRRVRS